MKRRARTCSPCGPRLGRARLSRANAATRGTQPGPRPGSWPCSGQSQSQYCHWLATPAPSQADLAQDSLQGAHREDQARRWGGGAARGGASTAPSCVRVAAEPARGHCGRLRGGRLLCQREVWERLQATPRRLWLPWAPEHAGLPAERQCGEKPCVGSLGNCLQLS